MVKSSSNWDIWRFWIEQLIEFHKRYSAILQYVAVAVDLEIFSMTNVPAEEYVY